MKKVVLAYSGGLDTSVIAKWLQEHYDYEVITFTADLGQGDDELVGLEEKAKATGATKAYIVKLIMQESLVLCVLGVIVGFGLSFLVKYIMHVTMPMTTVELRPEWMLYAALLGIVGGTLGSIYPAFRAARQDPIKALMYE